MCLLDRGNSGLSGAKLGYADRLILADGSLRSWGSSPCRLQPIAARLQLIAGSTPFKRQHRTPFKRQRRRAMSDFWRDRVYDLDLDSFVGTTPMPGALLGCSPELRDGWSDQVRVPGGLHEDDIRALGERTSTQHHRPAYSSQSICLCTAI